MSSNIADKWVHLCVCALIISVSLSWNVKYVNHWLKGHTEMSLLARLVKLSRLRGEKHWAAIFDLWIVPQMFEQSESFAEPRETCFHCLNILNVCSWSYVQVCTETANNIGSLCGTENITCKMTGMLYSWILTLYLRVVTEAEHRFMMGHTCTFDLTFAFYAFFQVRNQTEYIFKQ